MDKIMKYGLKLSRRHKFTQEEIKQMKKKVRQTDKLGRLYLALCLRDYSESKTLIDELSKSPRLLESPLGQILIAIYLKDTLKYTKYDHQGNWVQQIRFKGDKPTSITERDIEYYK